MNRPLNASQTWVQTLDRIIKTGTLQSPRGLQTMECLGVQSCIDMRFPVVTMPHRELSYDFMLAEALWILRGDNRVAPLLPYASTFGKYSDNGDTLFGAYGPKISQQILHVLRTLESDWSSRQAVINIWRENPPESKDIPCTISVQFLIRDGTLHCIDTMRSSDIWLGWPYDVFNFSMVSAFVVAQLKARGLNVNLGSLYLNAGSQHLYEKNYARAAKCVEAYVDGKVNPVYAPFDVEEFASGDILISHLWRLLHRGTSTVHHSFLTDLLA